MKLIKLRRCGKQLAEREQMIQILAVALGGALGAILRYGTTWAISKVAEGPAPIATWIVNLAGCLLIGFLVPYLASTSAKLPLKLFVLVGFLGSLTTFSTFSLESVALWQDGRIGLLMLNAVGSVVAGMLLVWAGMKLHEWV